MRRVITTVVALIFCTCVHSLTLGQRSPTTGGRTDAPSASQPSKSDQESLSSIGIEYCNVPTDCTTLSVYGKPKTCVHCRNRDGPKQGYCSEMLDTTLINVDWTTKTHDDLCRSRTYALHCGRCPGVETASGGPPVAQSPNWLSPGVQLNIPQPENPENYYLNPTADDTFNILTGLPETSNPVVPEQRLKTDQKPKIDQQPITDPIPPGPSQGPVLSFLPDSSLPMSDRFLFDPGYPSEDPLTGTALPS
ncbi:hypothetical protein MMC29_008417 [Sticta canariensis]|nr:hypothetical protein [Sticta canariensis]